MQKLEASFYNRADVLSIARDLLGKILVTQLNGHRCTARIVETEAYAGITDRASHAYGGRRTSRTEVMFGEPGHAYVYLCYGIHHLFNIVTNRRDIPHAILLRAVEPLEGISIMLRRTGKKKADHSLGRGPGNVARAMGIRTSHSGISLRGNKIYIADDGFQTPQQDIRATPRIGVDYAGADAGLLFRFILDGHPAVSGREQKRPTKKTKPLNH